MKSSKIVTTSKLVATSLCLGLSLLPCAASAAGRIFVNHDEWTLTKGGASTAQFVQNIADWFADGSSGTFLAYSSNFGVTSTVFKQHMTNAGHSLDVTMKLPFTVETLSAYDGVFVMGNAVDQSVLIEYVEQGGDVYLAAGTGWGGAVGEAAAWNTFLQHFGLQLEPYYNHTLTGGCIWYPLASNHPTLLGVSELYYCNGNSVTVLDLASPYTSMLHEVVGEGMLAIYDGGAAPPVVDVDEDSVPDDVDNCVGIANNDQADADLDGIGDACDVCPADPDNDIDGDSVCGDTDNCPDDPNVDQIDTEFDGIGDVCDDDDDNDGWLDVDDNCQFDANAQQLDFDNDGYGDVCDDDVDGDAVIDASDACLTTGYGAIVDPAGCSIADRCPCDADPSGTPWKNHGKYVSCVAHVSEDFLDLGLITAEEKDATCSDAGHSQCGK